MLPTNPLVNRPGLRWKVRLLIFFLVAASLGGWWWVVQRSLENERDAMLERMKEEQSERFDRALAAVSQAIDAEREKIERSGEVKTLSQAANLLREMTIDAIIFPEPSYDKISGEIEEAITWGSDSMGRDPILRQALSQLDNERVRSSVEERLLAHVGPPMKPSFRAWAIGQFFEITGEENDLLRRIEWSETVRAAGEVPENCLSFESEQSTFFWRSETLENAFSALGCGVVIGDIGTIFVPWAPSIRVKAVDMVWDESGFEESAAWIRRVGWGSAALFVMSVLAALWFGWKETQLARMRMDLAASMAHELRTPVAGQQLLLERMVDDPSISEEERDRYLNLTLRANKRLGRLAEQFLTFSRLERGVLSVEGETVNLKVLVDEVIDDWRERFDKISVVVSPEDQAYVNPQAVTTILSNLVENAWKYSELEKCLHIEVKRENDSVLIDVSDGGRGLNAEEKKRVFRRFWRAENTLARRTDGLGLGLSIVQQLVRAHGGDVKVEDADLGGARFIVNLKEQTE